MATIYDNNYYRNRRYARQVTRQNMQRTLDQTIYKQQQLRNKNVQATERFIAMQRAKAAQDAANAAAYQRAIAAANKQIQYKQNQEQRQKKEAEDTQVVAEKLFNTYDPSQFNSLADILLNWGAMSKKDGTWSEGAKYYLNNNFIKTNLTTTAKDVINSVELLQGNITLDEWKQRHNENNPLTLGQNLKNGLTSFGEDVDIFANMLKALVPTKWTKSTEDGSLDNLSAGQRFASVFGLSKEAGIGNRVSYDYDTGRGWLDIPLEVVTDPLNLLSWGAGAAGKTIFKNAVSKTTSALPEFAETAVKISAKSYGDDLIRATTNELSNALFNASKKEALSINLKRAARNLINEKTVAKQNLIAQGLPTNRVDDSIELLESIIKGEDRQFVTNVLDGVAKLRNTADTLDSVVLHLGTAELGFVHPVELIVKKGINKSMHNKRLQTLAYNELAAKVSDVFKENEKVFDEVDLKNFKKLRIGGRITNRTLPKLTKVFEEYIPADKTISDHLLKTIVDEYGQDVDAILKVFYDNKFDILNDNIKLVKTKLMDGKEFTDFYDEVFGNLSKLRELSDDATYLRTLDNIERNLKRAVDYEIKHKAKLKVYKTPDEYIDDIIKSNPVAKTVLEKTEPVAAEKIRKAIKHRLVNKEPNHMHRVLLDFMDEIFVGTERTKSITTETFSEYFELYQEALASLRKYATEEQEQAINTFLNSTKDTPITEIINELNQINIKDIPELYKTVNTIGLDIVDAKDADNAVVHISDDLDIDKITVKESPIQPSNKQIKKISMLSRIPRISNKVKIITKDKINTADVKAANTMANKLNEDITEFKNNPMFRTPEDAHVNESVATGERIISESDKARFPETIVLPKTAIKDGDYDFTKSTRIRPDDNPDDFVEIKLDEAIKIVEEKHKRLEKELIAKAGEDVTDEALAVEASENYMLLAALTNSKKQWDISNELNEAGAITGTVKVDTAKEEAIIRRLANPDSDFYKALDSIIEITNKEELSKADIDTLSKNINTIEHTTVYWTDAQGMPQSENILKALVESDSPITEETLKDFENFSNSVIKYYDNEAKSVMREVAKHYPLSQIQMYKETLSRDAITTQMIEDLGLNNIDGKNRIYQMFATLKDLIDKSNNQVFKMILSSAYENAIAQVAHFDMFANLRDRASRLITDALPTKKITSDITWRDNEKLFLEKHKGSTTDDLAKFVPEDVAKELENTELHDAVYDTILSLANFKAIRKNNQYNGDLSKVIIFDIESTGLDTSTDEILQLVIRDGNGKILFSNYIKPDTKKYWARAELVHHIDSNKVANEKTFAAYKDEVQKIFDNAELIVGHNIEDYDIPLIQRYGITIPEDSGIYDTLKRSTINKNAQHRKEIIQSEEFAKQVEYATRDIFNNFYSNKYTINSIEAGAVAQEIISELEYRYGLKITTSVSRDLTDELRNYIESMRIAGLGGHAFTPDARPLQQELRSLREDIDAVSTSLNPDTYAMLKGDLTHYIGRITDNMSPITSKYNNLANDYFMTVGSKYFVHFDPEGVVKSKQDIPYNNGVIRFERSTEPSAYMQYVKAGQGIKATRKIYRTPTDYAKLIFKDVDDAAIHIVSKYGKILNKPQLEYMHKLISDLDRKLTNAIENNSKEYSIDTSYKKHLEETNPAVWSNMQDAAYIIHNEFIKGRPRYENAITLDPDLLPFQEGMSAYFYLKYMWDKAFGINSEFGTEKEITDYMLRELRERGVDDFTLTALIDPDFIPEAKPFYKDSYALSRLNNKQVGESAFDSIEPQKLYPDETDEHIIKTLEPAKANIFFNIKAQVINSIKEHPAVKAFFESDLHGIENFKELLKYVNADTDRRIKQCIDYIKDPESLKTFIYENTPGRIYIAPKNYPQAVEIEKLLKEKERAFKRAGIKAVKEDNVYCIYLTKKVTDEAKLKKIGKTNGIVSSEIPKYLAENKAFNIKGALTNTRYANKDKYYDMATRDNPIWKEYDDAAYTLSDYETVLGNRFNFDDTYFDNLVFGDWQFAQAVYGGGAVYDCSNVPQMLWNATNRIGEYNASMLYFCDDLRPKFADVFRGKSDKEIAQWYAKHKEYTGLYFKPDEQGILKPYILKLSDHNAVKAARNINPIVCSRLEATNIIKNSRTPLAKRSLPFEILETVASMMKAQMLTSIGWVTRNFNSTLLKAIIDASESANENPINFIQDAWKMFKECRAEMQRFEECYAEITAYALKKAEAEALAKGLPVPKEIEITKRIRKEFFADKANKRWEDFADKYDEINDWTIAGYTSTLTSMLREQHKAGVIKGMRFRDVWRNREEIVTNSNKDITVGSALYRLKVAEEIAKAAAWKNPFTAVATKTNNSIEAYSRYFTYRWNLTHGSDIASAAEHVRKAHFDYDALTDAEELLNTVIPFINFKAANTKYWLETMYNHPYLMRAMLAQYKANGLYDMSDEEIIDNKALLNQLLNGNIPLGDYAKDVYFKLNGDYIDALQAAYNPIKTVIDSVLMVSTIKKVQEYKDTVAELQEKLGFVQSQRALYNEFKDTLPEKYQKGYEKSLDDQEDYLKKSIGWYEDNLDALWINGISPALGKFNSLKKTIKQTMGTKSDYLNGRIDEEKYNYDTIKNLADYFPSILFTDDPRYYFSYGNLNVSSKDYAKYLQGLKDGAQEGWAGVSHPVKALNTYYLVGFEQYGTALFTTDPIKAAKWIQKSGKPLNDEAVNLSIGLDIDRKVWGSTYYEDAQHYTKVINKINNNLYGGVAQIKGRVGNKAGTKYKYSPSAKAGTVYPNYTHSRYRARYNSNYYNSLYPRTQTQTRTYTQTRTQTKTSTSDRMAYGYYRPAQARAIATARSRVRP